MKVTVHTPKGQDTKFWNNHKPVASLLKDAKVMGFTETMRNKRQSVQNN